MDKQYLTLELDRPRRLRFDFNALADAEEALGKGLAVVLSGDMVGFRTLRALLWAGLKWEDRGLTIERMGQLIQKFIEGAGTLEALGDAIGKALELSGALGVSQGNATGAETDSTPT